MNNKLLTIGVALMTAALMMPADAHHIKGDPTPNGATSHNWLLPEGQEGLILCEDDETPADPALPMIPANEGIGGLCSMSVGHGGSHSDGKLPGDGASAEDGTTFNGTPDSDSVIEITMTGSDNPADLDQANIAVGWTAGVGVAFCEVEPGDSFRASEIFVYWANGGHVDGFVNTTALADLVVGGGYDASRDTSAVGTYSCDGATSYPIKDDA